MSRRSSLRTLLFVLACAAAPLGITEHAYADGMRCGTRLVSDGDTTLEVGERCGAPDASSQRIELRTVRSYVEGPCINQGGVLRCGTVIEQTIQIVIDEWSYDFGPDSLIRHLTFEQGKLLRVRTGGYGSKQT